MNGQSVVKGTAIDLRVDINTNRFFLLFFSVNALESFIHLTVSRQPELLVG